MHNLYSLRKSKKIFKSVYGNFSKKRKLFSDEIVQKFEHAFTGIDQALVSRLRDQASSYAQDLESLSKTYLGKSFFDYAKEFVLAVGLALIIAIGVRQSWFELYEIPSGSMRPTFREKDHLSVSKTAFGINIPLKTEHFYFDPDLVQRTGVLIFSADGIPMLDEVNYFWFFPYTKRLIKRMIAKPGDILYFYGGKIYGIDKNGNDLEELRNSPWMEPLEHIPFIHFEGVQNVTYQGNSPQLYFNHAGQPIGRLIISKKGEPIGQIFNGKEWIKDTPGQSSGNSLKTYHDFWGIGNFATARIISKEQIAQLYPERDVMDSDTGYFLELRHHPSLTYPAPKIIGNALLLNPHVSYLPLSKAAMDRILDHMYTARFVVKEGKAKRFSMPDELPFTEDSPRFPNISDGTYEFYFGKGYQVGFGGILKELPANHPLLDRSPANIQKLFNLGIEMHSKFEPYSPNQTSYPNRYAYFRNGDLYVLGAPLLKRNDPILQSFVQAEIEKQELSSSKEPYIAFTDRGPPVKNGELDKERIRNLGLKIPEKHYFVLGDNHAMSNDSRIFGFLPEANIQGAPSLIIWPPGERFGSPSQKPYPFLNFPRTIIWMIALLSLLGWFIYKRQRKKLNKYKSI